ncbi:hypothetical protein ACQHIV_40005 [Kribbella sp. GL6]|uniref:hypothetical protein n=1 Tax=Kribbella sp. GL6 TaxID=3419765 RepID=UPI003CFD157F
MPASRTAEYLTQLVDRYLRAQTEARHRPVLLVDSGYEVCRWVSLEQLIAESADEE